MGDLGDEDLTAAGADDDDVPPASATSVHSANSVPGVASTMGAPAAGASTAPVSAPVPVAADPLFACVADDAAVEALFAEGDDDREFLRVERAANDAELDCLIVALFLEDDNEDETAQGRLYGNGEGATGGFQAGANTMGEFHNRVVASAVPAPTFSAELAARAASRDPPASESVVRAASPDTVVLGASPPAVIERAKTRISPARKLHYVARVSRGNSDAEDSENGNSNIADRQVREAKEQATDRAIKKRTRPLSGSGARR